MGDKERDDATDSDYNPGKDLPQLDYDPHKKSWDDSAREHGGSGSGEGDDDDYRSGKE